MKQLILTNGATVRFERSETHGDKVLFYREPIGLIWTANINDIKEILNDTNQNGNAPGGAISETPTH